MALSIIFSKNFAGGYSCERGLSNQKYCFKEFTIP
jgi:hypothetical protein